MKTLYCERNVRGLRCTWITLGMICALSICLCGCGGRPQPSGTASEAGSGKPVNSSQSPIQGTEAEARAAVKTALDSWAFGDSEEQFKKAHPGIHFLDFNRITRKLGRYEIGTIRQDGNSFEFLVTLTYKEESGDVTRSGNYTVVKNAEGEWEIFGGTR